MRIAFEIENQPYQNPVNAYDTNADGEVSTSDALMVLNRLREKAIGASSGLFKGLLDVSGDYQITALDALLVINQVRIDTLFASLGGLESEGEDEDWAGVLKSDVPTLF